MVIAIKKVLRTIHLFNRTVRKIHSSSFEDRIINMQFKYPTPRKDLTVIDDYHGFKVADPYRWMEDADSEETKKFVNEQNALSRPFLDSCPIREDIKTRLTELWNFERYSCPYQHGNKYFYYYNSGLQNQSVLYMKEDGVESVFLDPNVLSTDGTVALRIKAFSEDDKIFAYGLSADGSDWVTVQFKHVDTGEIYPEKLEKVKFSSLSWTHDNKGLFYGCYKDQEGKTDGSETEKNKNQKVYYHLIGTPQENDVLAIEFPEEPQYIIGTEVSYCGRWLIVTLHKGCKDNLVYASDLSKLPDGKITKKLDLIPVVTKMEADYEYVTNDGSVCIFKTNKNTPNYRLVAIDLENPSEECWSDLVVENKKVVLEWAQAVNNDQLVLCYIEDVKVRFTVKLSVKDKCSWVVHKNVLQLHSLGTGEHLSTFLLETGTIIGFSGKRKYKDIFYQFSSFLTPGIIYHCDLSKPGLTPEIYRETKMYDFDPGKFTTEQVFYTSKDGTKVPMFIVYKKTLQKNGLNPCMLYGYGGFNISLLPAFSVSRVVWVDNLDGVYAIPNIRGGGEYGEKWHNSGRLENKQNCFDDFHAAAEYLVTNKYTSANLTCINGGSNGGLLVAACANQRPDLYGAVIVDVGVLDMLRFHEFTIGYSWVSDYGCSKNEKDFHTMIKYSPLHNITVPKEEHVQYPATLLLTADHDDRVVPLHSLKFIATLQDTFRNCEKQKNPLLIRVETKAGHGGGKPTTKLIEETADLFSFVTLVMDLSFTK